MGRFDKIYSDDHVRRITQLMVEDGIGPTPAVALLHEETGVTMPVDTARKIAASARRKYTPKLDKDNPIGPMVERLLRLYNAELHGIECKRTKTDADLERAGRITKALIDLDKLRKTNAQPAEKADNSPLAGLMSDRKLKGNGRENPGSVAASHDGVLVSPGNAVLPEQA
jgi:hypothetical protein